jgi:type IV pilus assembly protein PilC
MAEFRVKVADERGNLQERVDNAASAAELRDRLTSQGYHVYWIKPRGVLGGGRRRVKMEAFIIFNQQFLTLIRAGLPIVQALELLSRRQKSEYLRQLLENVREQVKGGVLLSEAFAAQGAFPKIYSTTMMAGEKSGNLDEVLARYVSFQRLTLSFRKKLLASLVYPCILFVGIGIMLTVMVTFVVPRFASLYTDLGQELPAATRLTIAVSHHLTTLLPFLLVLLGGTFFGLTRWARTTRGGRSLDRMKLRMPLLGEIWLRYQVSVFSRMLSTLLSGGLPLVTGLETAGESMQSRLMAEGIRGATRSVREGQPLAKSLEETEIFPEMAVEMVEVGESTGALPQMLTSVAEFFEEDVQTALAAAMSLVEPVTLVFMGVIVGFILFSLYLPIFSMGVNIH